jgi:serine/threonine protein kinase/tetratricopeptide (TPR) repeat protein
MSVDVDHHLLFGLLALQNGLIDQGQLAAAFKAWELDKSRGLADYLESHGALTRARRELLDGLAAVHVETHDDNVEKSLAAIYADKSTRESLAGLGDPDLEATLEHVASRQDPTAGDKDYHTPHYAVGTATSGGQRFRVLRPYARGGLGAVFVALDAELNREVALKQILDHHADDPGSRQRFLLEAEVTGGLEHPGIVPVYGLGTYADGRPYYAMRFIRGDSLKEAIDRYHEVVPHAGAHPSAEGGQTSGKGTRETPAASRDLELRNLLRRFTDVCNAIDYAHSRGVLHRDIKPGNVIVGKHGETLVVDWGLAKPLGRIEPGAKSGERTLMPSSASGSSSETLPGSVLGTPAYMSPEQAEGALDRLGPRSDVYSLGATLYYLLTGKPAFEGDDILEVLRKVRCGQLVDPRQVDPSIDRALEAVCLKAMAIRPEDRYATPRELADDVDRWMADVPVTAWREPLARRARRWAKQNRTAAAASGVAVVVALFGLSGVLFVQARANKDLLAANQREHDRFELAMEAIQIFHGGVSEDVLLKQKEFLDLRTKLLRGAQDFYGKLQTFLEGHADRRSRAALGNAYSELGVLTSEIGSKQEGLAIHRRALALRRALAAEAGAGTEDRANVGKSLIDTAYALLETSDMNGALMNFEEGRRLFEKARQSGHATADQEDLAKCLIGMGQVMFKTGQTSQALAAYEQALAIDEALMKAHPDAPRYRLALAQVYNGLGYFLSSTKATSQAVTAYERAKTIQAELVAADPSATKYRSELALSLINLGNIHYGTGRRAESNDAYQRASDLLETLVKANPTVSTFQRDLARCYNNIGYALSMTGPPAQALAAYERGRTLREALAKANPTAADFQRELASSNLNIGYVLSETGRFDEALASFGRSREISEALAKAAPDVTQYQADAAAAHFSIAGVLAQMDRLDEALASTNRARLIQEALAHANPDTTRFSGDLAASHCYIGDMLAESGRSSEAIASYQRALAIQEKLVKSNPSVQLFKSDLERCFARIGNVLAVQGRRDEAIANLEKSRVLCEALRQANPTVLQYQTDLARAQEGLAALFDKMGRSKEALTAYEQALAIQRQLASAQPNNGHTQSELGTTLVDVGIYKARHADPAAGLRLCRQALEVLERSNSTLSAILVAKARAHAQIGQLSAALSEPRTGDETDSSSAHLGAAMSLLRRAVVANGYRDHKNLEADAAFDPIRARPDFQSLVCDLVFPANPFAPDRGSTR